MTDSPKRHRYDNESPNKIEKYPFVDYDGWMTGHTDQEASIIIKSTSHAQAGTSSTVPMMARPAPVWLSLTGESGVSSQSKSAQYSSVSHSPTVIVDAAPESTDMMIYSSWDLVNNFISFRSKLPAEIFHPYFASDVFFQALIADVISNSVRRDPTLYKYVWPRSVMGIPSSDTDCDIAIAETISWSSEASCQYRLPWVWERNNRRSVLSCVIQAISKTTNDVLIPFHGLILSPWIGGVLFRLSQLFFKVTVVRSQLSPRWDDTCFIFCQGKRSSSKLVDKALKLLTRLNAQDTCPGAVWGYSAPPVCFADPAWIDWIRSINAQLIGSVRPSHAYQPEPIMSIYKLASVHRLKKYLFPHEIAKIGFYFGSFNPVHENHVALGRFAHTQLGLARVVYVPNNDEHEVKKDDLLSLSHRVCMLKIRSHAEPGDWMDVAEPSGSTKRWESKAEIAEKICSSMFAESPVSGVPVLILGQDSWNKAVLGSSRDKTTRHFIGISKLVKMQFFIFPRTNQEEPVLPTPKPIRDNVSVIEGYTDPFENLSSSRIRESIRNGVHVDGIHESVIGYIRNNKLYE